MSISRAISVPNGDILVKLYYFKCDGCGTEFFEGDPHTIEDSCHFCNHCSFKRNNCTEKEYLNSLGIGIPLYKAKVVDGEIIVWSSKKPPWEKKNKEYRKTKAYKDWRTSVFERDKYTCQHCGQVGGELNAHHIKTFAKYKDLRYELTNGLTLCVDCHRNEHRKR